MAVKVGLRVVRGPDWERGNEDGGEGYVGTVVAGARDDARHDVATVRWDVGGENVYRCGAQGKFDLRVIDSAPAGVVHRHMECSGCGSESIAGCVWRCLHCLRYYLCTVCYMKDRHSVWHHFMRIDSPENPRQRTRVQCRYQSGRVAARGVFVGARVVRGGDWRWGDQDGGAGREGSVVEIGGWQRESSRSVAVVEWRESGLKRKYRLGHKGKVDVECRVAAEGGHCYLDHLPLLGSEYKPPTTPFICAGDRVQLVMDIELLKSCQDKIDAWDDGLIMFLGKVGLVLHVTFKEEEVHVIFNAPSSCRISYGALIRLDGPDIAPGDVVRVSDDIAEVYRLQQAGCGWDDDMVLCLGQLGRIVKFMFDSPGVVVKVNGRRWHLDPLCLTPAPGEQLQDEENELEPEERVNPLMLSVMAVEPTPGVLFGAVSQGDYQAIAEILKLWPHLISVKHEDKSLLHIAAAKGRAEVTRVLVEHNADITATTARSCEMPIHTATHFNSYEVAKVLLEKGCDPNVVDHLGRTPAHIAAAWGYTRILALLLSYPNCQMDMQDNSGNTPLYVSSQGHQRDTTRLLLERGANMTVVGNMSVNPFMFAVIRKFLAGVEIYLEYDRTIINGIKTNTSFTALHIATQLNFIDIICYLASLETCDLEKKTYEGCSALGIACDAGNIVAIECLVGYGADVNAKGNDGRSLLHLVLGRKNMQPLSEWNLHLNEFHEYVSSADNRIQSVPIHVTVACFLVSEGANLEVEAAFGLTPLSICPTEYQSLLQLFARPERRGHFRGSLQRYAPPVLKKPGSELLTEGKVAKSSELKTTPTKSEATPKSEATTTKSEATPPEVVPVSGGDSNKTEESEVDSETGPSCFLCEGPCDITFQPCGHTAMCAECAEPVKRCPTCKTVVETKIKQNI